MSLSNESVVAVATRQIKEDRVGGKSLFSLSEEEYKMDAPDETKNFSLTFTFSTLALLGHTIVQNVTV